MISPIKQLIKNVMGRRGVARMVVLVALKLHNLSYAIAGRFSQFLEPDGLHPKHRIIGYHEWFKRMVQPEWHVLDIGCGNGALSYDLKDRCASVVGIDINEQNIKKAQQRYSRSGVTFICEDARAAIPEGRFDCFILSNVLEHIDDRVGLLIRLYQNSGSAPVLFIRVPYSTRDWITPYKREMGVEWRLDKTHYIEYTPEELQHEVEKAGLILKSFEIRFGEIYAVVCKKDR